jgi:hypothetical protein
MPTNTVITTSIVFPGQVPSDRECQISNLSEIIQGVVDFTSIASTSPDGNPSPPDDSVAQQALSTANAALALAQSVQASQKQTRSSVPQAIPTGDSAVAFPFSSPMPDTNYFISITFFAGSSAHPSTYYGYRILESSITVNGFTALFDNAPSNTKVALYAVQN